MGDKPDPSERCDEAGCEEFACVRVGGEQKCLDHALERAEMERRRRNGRLH